MSAFLSWPQWLKEHINTLHCWLIENEIQWWQVDSRLLHLLTPTTECFVFTTPICRLWSRMSYSGWQTIGIKRFIQFSPKYVHGFVARFRLWWYNEFVAISCGAQCGTFITRSIFSRIFTMDTPLLACEREVCSVFSWWRHQIETFSALLAVCAGNSPVTGEFPAQRPVTRSFVVFFDLHLNTRLSTQSWGWWFETPSRPLWHHCNMWV